MKKITTLFLYLFTALTLTACAGKPIKELSKSSAAERKNVNAFVGSKFALNDNYSMTALHVAQFMGANVVASLPQCDLAIIEDNNKDYQAANFSFAVEGEKATANGFIKYSVSSIVEVKVEETIQLESESLSKDCSVVALSPVTKKGMSGSPVYNNKNEVIGVIVAIQTRTYRSGNVIQKGVMVPTQSFAKWLAVSLQKEKVNFITYLTK